MPYIFESPDGGKTVFARQYNEPEREKVYESEQSQVLRQQVLEAELWSRIRIAALTNPGIADALNKARVLYELSSNDHDKM